MTSSIVVNYAGNKLACFAKRGGMAAAVHQRVRRAADTKEISGAVLGLEVKFNASDLARRYCHSTLAYVRLCNTVPYKPRAKVAGAGYPREGA